MYMIVDTTTLKVYSHYCTALTIQVLTILKTEMHAYVRVHSETYVLVCVYLIVIHAYVRVDMVKTQCMHPPANDTQQPRDGTAEHNNRRKRLDADCSGVRCGLMSTAVGVRWLGLVWVVGCHRQGGGGNHILQEGVQQVGEGSFSRGVDGGAPCLACPLGTGSHGGPAPVSGGG